MSFSCALELNDRNPALPLNPPKAPAGLAWPPASHRRIAVVEQRPKTCDQNISRALLLSTHLVLFATRDQRAAQIT